jgi:glycosyltransferase involved in cell wall biosynthesis
VVDSSSTDQTVEIAKAHGAEVVQFRYAGGYPKKRQWVMNQLPISTQWVFLVDADEVITPELWGEITRAIAASNAPHAFLMKKSYHFLGRRFRFGGFSFHAVLLFRRGKAHFEQLTHAEPDGLDMEVHERLIVDGPIGSLQEPLLHEDFKSLEAYIERHNKYSTWEARLRKHYFDTGVWGLDTVQSRLFGDTQERRRFLKLIAIRLPCEAHAWFAYHYFLRLGILEGRRGLIACQIRANYIRQIRSKLFELRLRRDPAKRGGGQP